MHSTQRLALTFLFSALSAASLAACAGDDDGSTATETGTTTTATATSTMTSTATATMTETGTGTESGTATETGTTTATTGTTTSTTDTTGGLDGAFCAHQCSADADCLVDGDDIGLTCEDSFCVGDGGGGGCTDDAECVALFSGWSTPCTSGGGECDGLGQVCIMAGDGGLCALPPSDFFMCETINFAELEVPDIDGNPVTVCAQTKAECSDDGICMIPCQADADCPSDAYPVCDTGTGICGCGSDADCATLGQPASSVCNAGVCGCGSDQNCVDGDVGDICNEGGFCGCSGDRACADVVHSFDGGMIACVNL